MSQKNLAQIKIYGTLWNDEESGVTAIAQQIWDTERECWVSEYPDLFGGDPGELPNIPRIDKTLTLADYAADSYEVGIRLKQIQESIDKFPIPKPEKYRGNITLTDLLLISNPIDGLMYYVYNSGNEVEGYGDENFTFNGKSYLAGSTMVYEIDHWRVLGPEEDNKEYKASTFDILQNKIILPFDVNRNVAFPNTRNNAYRSGLRLFDAYVYNLTDKGYVREFSSEMGTISDRWTFMIPFASSYSVGMNEEMEYASGIMTAEQLRHLYTHKHKWDDIQSKPNFSNVAFSGSYNDLTDIPENVDIENVVKYVSQTLTESQKAQARTNIGAGTSNFSGRYADLIGKPDIPDSVTDVVRYVTQSLNPTQKAQARSNIGAGTGNGTVTSVSVKMNGTTKGTITSSGEIDLGTVLTQHQSLDGYATESWVLNQGYINGSELFDYATKNWVESQGYLKSIPSTVATKQWVQEQGYGKRDTFFCTETQNISDGTYVKTRQSDGSSSNLVLGSGNDHTKIVIRNTDLSTEAEYRNYLAKHRVTVAFTYAPKGTDTCSWVQLAHLPYKVGVTSDSIVINLDGSAIKDPNPTNYIAVFFDKVI